MIRSLPNNLCTVAESLYDLIIKAFQREVTTNNRKGYLFSALFADLLFKSPTMQLDAIYYPSVPNKNSSMNLAVLPDALDAKFDFVEAYDSVVMSAPSDHVSGWLNFVTGNCKLKPNTLELHWENSFCPNDHYVMRLIRAGKLILD
jgi:hypothetical protein